MKYTEKLGTLIEPKQVLTSYYDETYNLDKMISRETYLGVYNQERNNIHDVDITRPLMPYKQLLDELIKSIDDDDT